MKTYRRVLVGVALTLTVMVHASAAHAGAAMVQQVVANRGNVATNVAPSWPAPTTAGHLLVAIVAFYGTATSTVTPPTGKGWTLAARSDEGTTVSTAVYYIANAASQSGSSSWAISTPTSGMFTAGATAAVQLIEYSGVLATSPLDVTGTASGPVTSSSGTTTATAATSQASELAILAFTGYRHDVLTAEGATFSQVGTSNQPGGTSGTTGDNMTEAAYQDLYTGATTPTGTIDIDNPRNWAGVIVTFKVPSLYWVGCTGNLWTSAACWSTTSGGTGGAGPPATTDGVVFDGAGTNGNNSPVFSTSAATTVGAIDIKGTYAGTLNYNSTGQTLTINSDLSVEFGSFTVTAGTLAFASGATLHVAGGTFTAGGTVTFAGSNSVGISSGTLNGNGIALSFQNLAVTGGTYNTGAGALAVSGTFTMSGGTVSTGSGGVTITGAATQSGGTFTSGSAGALVTFSSTLDLNTTAAMKATPGNITVAGAVTMEDSSTYTGASGTTSTFSTTLVMSGGTITTGSGTFHTDGNVTIQGGTFTNSGTTSTTIGTVGSTNKLTITSGAVAVTGGTLEVTAAFAISGGTYTGASGATLTLDATGAVSGGTVDLAGGTLAVASGGGQLTISNGTFAVDAGTLTTAHEVLVSGGAMDGKGTLTLSRNAAPALYVTSGSFDLDGGALTVSNNNGGIEIDAGTFKATSGTITDAGTLMVLGGTFDVNGGSVTIAKAVTISGGTYQSTGSGSVSTFQSTVAVSGGTFDGGAGAATVTGLVTVSGTGTFNIGTSTTGQILNGGLAMTAGTLSGTSSAGVLSIAAGKSIAISGGTFSTTSASTSGPTIKSVTGTFTFGVTAGTVTVDGLKLTGTDTAGFNINATAAISELDYVDFKPASNPASASYVLTINLASLTLFSTGCIFDFDPTTFTNEKNVHLTGTGTVNAVRAHFQYRSTAVNGLGAGDRYDGDEDTLPGTAPYYDDGVGDTGKDAVAYWDYAAATDTAGTAEGFPTAAFDWTTFNFYSVYAAFTNTIYVRDTNGTPVSSYVTSAGDGTIVGTPMWNTESGQHVVYVAMSGGKIYRLVDSSGTLTLAASPWSSAFQDATNVASITTALVGDGTNIYFAGATSGGTPSIYGVSISTKAIVKQVVAAATVTATPNVGTSSGSTFLFVGSGLATSTASIYRVDITAGVHDAVCTQATASIAGATRISGSVLYAGDGSGKLHGIDAFNFNSGGFINTTGFPYQDTVGSAAINTAPYIDRNHGKIYFGDSQGYLHGISTAGVQTAQLQVSTSALSSPITVTSGIVLVGDAASNIFYVNTSTSTYSVYYTVNLGSGSVGSIAYDADSGTYMASTSTGHLVYLPATP